MAIMSIKTEYAIGQLSGPVIMLHSDIPPIPARSVSGMKTVLMTVSHRTAWLVRLAVSAIRLLIMDRYISMRLVIISR